MTDKPEVTVTEDDRRRGKEIADKWVVDPGWPHLLSECIALALAETRELAEAPLRDDRDRLLRFVQSWVEEGYDRDEAIDVLATTDGPDFSDRIAELEAENARLQQFLDRLLTACMFADEGDHLPLQDARKAGERILAEHRRATS